MSWQRGNNPFTFYTGNGIRRKDAIGQTVNYGPSGQRYIIRFNILGSFLGISWVNGTAYQWANWYESEGEFRDTEPATEADWSEGWQLGPYEQPEPDQIHTPEEVSEANRNPAPDLSYLKDTTNQKLAAIAATTIVLIVIIWNL